MESINDLGIDDIMIFSRNGLVAIDVVDIKELPGLVNPGKGVAVVVYGHCSDGNQCRGIHGVAFEPELFSQLVESLKEKSPLTDS